MNSDNIIWRYFDFPKFVDLLQTSTLFFERGDKLIEFDKKEGSIFSLAMEEDNADDPTINNLLNTDFPISQEDINKWIFINCWHRSPKECYAMWRVYGKDFGVCIRSSINKLQKSFANSDADDEFIVLEGVYQTIWNDKVIVNMRYYSDDEDYIHTESPIDRFTYKRKEFEYEKETRCVIYFPEGCGVNVIDGEMQGITTYENIKLDINLDSLIDEICISPFAPSWIYSVVEDLCKKYQLNKKITQSTI
jgi:hypothetical protein